MSDTPNYDIKIAEFFQRIQERLVEYEKKTTVPRNIYYSMKHHDTLVIYHNILSNENLKKAIIERLRQGQPVRIAKELNYSVRTLNIVFEPETNDICLMLDTKSKMAQSDKKNRPTVLYGRWKTVKPAWRIDTPLPIKYANAVCYFKEAAQIEFFKEEVATPYPISKKYTDYEHSLHLSAMGAAFAKIGYRKNPPTLEEYHFKASYYSKWANESTLDVFLNKRELNLTFEECDILAMQLLFAVKLLHDENIVHQDIKPANILIFKKKQAFSLELTDFGSACHLSSSMRKKIALASSPCESPEISAIHLYFRDKEAFSNNYHYFHQQYPNTIGRVTFLNNQLKYRELVENNKLEFIRPNKANDMWAVGIVLRTLYKSFLSTDAGKQKYNTLISKLLHLDRKERLTADAASDLQCREMVAQHFRPRLFNFVQIASAKRAHQLNQVERPQHIEEPEEESQPLEPAFTEAPFNSYSPAFKAWSEPSSVPALVSTTTHLDSETDSCEKYFNSDYFKNG